MHLLVAGSASLSALGRKQTVAKGRYGSLAVSRELLLPSLSYACDWSDRMQVTGHVVCKRLVSIGENHWSLQVISPPLVKSR